VLELQWQQAFRPLGMSMVKDASQGASTGGGPELACSTASLAETDLEPSTLRLREEFTGAPAY
jgi:hypothetical protein